MGKVLNEGCILRFFLLDNFASDRREKDEIRVRGREVISSKAEPKTCKGAISREEGLAHIFRRLLHYSTHAVACGGDARTERSTAAQGQSRMRGLGGPSGDVPHDSCYAHSFPPSVSC